MLLRRKGCLRAFFYLLPADKMAGITMHKIVRFIRTAGENGCAKVVSTIGSIGQPIEQ